MTSTKRDFEYQSVQDSASIVKYLRALADGFERGHLAFSDKKGEVTLEPRGLIDFEVRASKKSDRTRVSLHFRWRRASDDGGAEVGPLFITAGDE